MTKRKSCTYRMTPSALLIIQELRASFPARFRSDAQTIEVALELLYTKEKGLAAPLPKCDKPLLD